MDTESTFEQAETAYRAGDYLTALELWLPLAEAGDEDAYYIVGHIHCLSLTRFQRVKETQTWHLLEESDFQRWDAEDGPTSLKWLTKPRQGEQPEEPPREIPEEEDDHRPRMYNALYSSPLSGLNRALFKAIAAIDPVSVAALLDRGADVEATTEDGSSAISWACQHVPFYGGADGDSGYEIIKLLVQRGADVNSNWSSGWDSSVLSHVAQVGNYRMVKLLLDHGAHVNDGEEGSEALYNTAKQDNFEIAWLLLERGAEINAKPYCGYSALMAASALGAFSVTYLLLSRGADVNARNADGKTVLTQVLEFEDDGPPRHDRKKPQIVELLKGFGAHE